jgi:hypothetical protein
MVCLQALMFSPVMDVCVTSHLEARCSLFSFTLLSHCRLASGASKEPSIPDYVNFHPEPLQDTHAHVLNVEKVHSAPVPGATSVQADSDSMCAHPDIEPFPAGQQGVSAMQEGIRYHAPFDHCTCEVEGITMMADDAPKSEGCLEHTLADKQSPGPLEVQAPDQMHKGARWWDDYLFGCHPVGRMFGGSCCCIFSCNDILACGGWVLGFDISDLHGVASTLVPFLNAEQEEI